MLNAASKGCVVVFDDKTTKCPGGRVGLGFNRFQLKIAERIWLIFCVQIIPQAILIQF